MYDFIIKTSDERTLYFFNKNGICVKDLFDKTDRYKVIYEDGIKDFSVEDLGFGEVGIVCQNKEGSIVFIKENGADFIKTILLNNKSHVYYDKYFKLKMHGNWLGLSYIIEYNGNNILSFQIINNENEPPLAVDYITGKNYFSFVTGCYDRIFFYNKEGELGYKIFRWAKKNFSEYEKLDDGQLIYAINDFSDNYYVIYLKNNKYILKVLKNNEESFDKEDYPLDFIDLFDEVIMMIEKENLWIVVKRYNFTFGRKTNLDNISFSSQYNFFTDGEIRKFSLSVRDKDKIAECCFGSLVKLMPEPVLYKDLFNFKNSIKSNEVILEENETELGRLKIEINKLDIRINKLEKRIEEVIKNDK